MKKPVLNISFILTCPDPKIIALGGVATGSINAHESDIVAGISTKRMSERKSTTEKKDYSHGMLTEVLHSRTLPPSREGKINNTSAPKMA